MLYLAFTLLFAAELIFMVSTLDEPVEDTGRDFTQCLPVCTCRGSAAAGGPSFPMCGGGRGGDHRGSGLIRNGGGDHAS